MRRCVESVAALGLEHEVLGDELLDLAPAGLDVLPRTDVARLVLLQDRLRSHDRVVWLDADVLVFAPEHVRFDLDADLAVGHEVWVTGGPGGALRAVELVCNAVLVARPGGVDELLAATLARAEAGEVTTRSLGPDLLTVLHRRSPFATVPGVGLCSPMVVADLAAGGGPAWDLQVATEPWPLGAANLCRSMAADDGMLDAAVSWLSGRPSPGGSGSGGP